MTLDISHHLKESLRALASSFEDQSELFPEFVCKADELALEFSHWSQVFLSQGKPLLSEAEAATLHAIEQQLEQMSSQTGSKLAQIWSDHGLASAPEWARLRNLAMEALVTFGWTYEKPVLRSSIYIPGTPRYNE